MRHARFRRRRGMQLAVCSVALITALALNGCANPIERLVDEALSGSSSRTAEDAIKGVPDGVLPGVGSDVPSDFPDTVPLPDRKPTTAVRHAEDGNATWALHYHEQDGPAGFEALAQELGARGFIQESDTAMGDQMRVALYADDDHTVSLSLLGEKGDQILQILVMEVTDD